jgi:transcriptional regulator with XRE-family HTH domain
VSKRHDLELYCVQMVDYRSAGTFGERVQAARKSRGIRSAQALAELIDTGTITDSIIRNIESGRLTNPTISQVLNLAFALHVAPSFLLAPLGDPQGQVDLPGLSSELAAMRPPEFDAWLSGSNSGAYRATTSMELAERNEITAFRDLETLLRERRRLRTTRGLAAREVSESQPGASTEWDRTSERLAIVEEEISNAARFLTSAGWTVDSWVAES